MTETAVLQMLVSGQNDLEWFESNLDSLKSKYDRNFIAFHNKEVIDSDTNVDVLMNKLRSKGLDTSNIFVKFVSKIRAIL